jgi:IS605 OrfB family transposase
MKENVKRKTLSNWLFLPSDQKKVINLMSHESKNVFNHYVFCCRLFNEYKRDIYKKLLKIKTNDINESIISELEKYYKVKTDNFDIIKTNNEIIYKYITEQNPKIYHNDFDENLKKYKNECKKLTNIKILKEHVDMTFNDIVYNILKSRYFRNYYKLKSELVNHKKPTDIVSKEFIDHVKSKTTIFDTDNYHEILKNKYLNKITLKSEQNLMRRFAYKTLSDCHLPSDIIINIMDKCFTAYSSFMACKRKGLRTGQIKYLPKEGHFLIPFFSHCFKIENNRIRLSIGVKIAKLIGNKNDDKFLYFSLPNKLTNKKIKMIEIIPFYDGYKYKMNISYEDINEIKEPIVDMNKKISIDIGVQDLMVIYDPESDQKIINGSIITSTNYYFNKQIDDAKSKLPNGRKTSKKIRNLLIKRENTMNYRMNKIVKYLFDKYNHKDTIIIGYNEGWKQEVNMGRDMNRKFYEIPYDRLIKKIESKFQGTKIIRIGEAYTSKCDSLSLEEIRRHDTYNGKRIKRGLYSSKTHKLINADLNGAINIMRLYCKKERIPFENVNGINLCNPRRVKIEL